MQKQIFIVLLITLFSITGFSQEFYDPSRTEYKDDAGQQGSKSGFFQTSLPVNYPEGASSYWHLLDVRHSNPANNYSMQFAGSFFDQNLYFRKTNNYAPELWSRVVLERDNKVGVGTSTPFTRLHIHDGADRNLLFRSAGDLIGVAGMAIQSVNDANLEHLPLEIESSLLLLNAGTGANVGIGTANTSSWGKLTLGGNLVFANDVTDYLISGPANGGAIRIKSNGALPDRYIQLGQIDNNKVFYPYLSIADGGNVVIGTTTPGAYKLAVRGAAIFTKVQVKADNGTSWPDYVFHKTYQLRSLSALETYIQENKHLPDVPSAKEVEANGVDLGTTQAALLKKIEELTLYVIEQDKKNLQLQQRVEQLEKNKTKVEN